MAGILFVRCVSYAVWKGYANREKSNCEKFWGAVSTKSVVLFFAGVYSDVLKTLEKMLSNKNGLHYLYIIHTLLLEKKLRKPSYFVMGWIDMFAPLRTLLPHIIDCLDGNRKQNILYSRKDC